MLEEEREKGDMRENCDQLLYSCFLPSYHHLSDLLSFILLLFHVFSSHFFSSCVLPLIYLLCVSFLFPLFSAIILFPLLFSCFLLSPLVFSMHSFHCLPLTFSHFLPLCNLNFRNIFLFLFLNPFLLASSHFILFCLIYFFPHFFLSNIISSCLLVSFPF